MASNEEGRGRKDHMEGSVREKWFWRVSRKQTINGKVGAKRNNA
jgi:hypothetical protein